MKETREVRIFAQEDHRQFGARRRRQIGRGNTAVRTSQHSASTLRHEHHLQEQQHYTVTTTHEFPRIVFTIFNVAEVMSFTVWACGSYGWEDRCEMATLRVPAGVLKKIPPGYEAA